MIKEYLLMNQTAPMLRFSCERSALISKLALIWDVLQTAASTRINFP